MPIKPALLKQVIIEQQAIRLPVPCVLRECMQTIEKHIHDPHIIILSGLRRVGKSTVLQQIRKNNAEPEYYINFDDDRLVNFTVEDFQLLLEVFIELFAVKNTFFFDEIQNIPNWERFIRRLHDQGKKIFITGSNAQMLSQELGTRLTGRYLQLELYPYSFAEWVGFVDPGYQNKKIFSTEDKGLLKRHFNDYFNHGGIPEFVKNGDIGYLQTLYESILYRDILTRFKTSSEKALKELVFYLASNIGKDVSYNALRKMLNLASANTVSDYCQQLANSYLCMFINRYDFSIRKQLNYVKKNYFIDPAMARAVGFYISEDKGRMLENIVFLELKRRFTHIYFHRQNTECDFIVRIGAKVTVALQVCMHLQSADTKEREIKGLLDAMLAYHLHEGWILTEDTEDEWLITKENRKYTVHVLPIWKWLLS